MNLKSRSSILFALLAVLAIVGTLHAQGNLSVSMLTVKPQEDTTTILSNPMAGFEDHNIDSNWWPTSSGYLRATTNCIQNGRSVPCGPLNWDRLNPSSGVYNFGDIDLYLQNMRDREKVAGFRVRTIAGPGTTPAVPAWAKSAGVTTSLGAEPWGGDKDTEVDYHKCTFLDLWGKMVNEMVRKYDNHPQVAYVDIGSYGYYGEWFSGKTVLQRSPESQEYDSSDPTLQQSIDTRTRIVRMFTGGSGSGHCVDNSGRDVVVNYSYPGFKNTPVILNQGDKEDIAIGVASGAGIRFDGVGAIDARQKRFRDGVGTYVNQIWKTTPILGEFGTADYAPVDSGIMMRSLCFAREFYVSSIHNNFNNKPGVDMTPLFRELGYRVVMQQATYPSIVAAGTPATFSFTWVNKGTSPAYTRYPLYLYFKPRGQNSVSATVELTDTSIRAILPGGVTTKSDNFTSCTKGTPPPYLSGQTFTVPQLAAGVYDLYFAFIDQTYNKPIEIAHTQKDTDGRYLLGQITIQSSGGATPTIRPTNTPGGPTPTVAPTNTPGKTATPRPTVPPTIVPSATPILTSNTLRAQYEAADRVSNDDQISPAFNIINNTSSAVALNSIKLRYYFTRDTSKTLKFACDYATLGCKKITGTIVALPTPVNGADHYLEVGFTSTSGNLAGKGHTGEILVRLYKEDWSDFNETNDYSFNASFTYFKNYDRVTLHQSNKIVWGIAPGGIYAGETVYEVAPIFDVGDNGAPTSTPAARPPMVTRRGQLYWRAPAYGCVGPQNHDAWTFELPLVKGQTGRNIWFDVTVLSGNLKLDLSPYAKWYDNKGVGQEYRVVVGPLENTTGCYSFTIHSDYEED